MKTIISKDIMREEIVNKIFGSINSHILNDNDKEIIKEQLVALTKKNESDYSDHDMKVYYFYSLLHERYYVLKNNEKEITNFFDVCNKYYTNKYFEFDDKEYSYSIKMKNSNKKIRNVAISDLSSGEKQIAAMFSYLFLYPFKKILIIVDEPEMSLSVEWQEQFLLDIVGAKRFGGLIAVTHSPFLFNNNLRKYARGLYEFMK